VWDSVWLNLWSKGLQRPASKKVSQRGTALKVDNVEFTSRQQGGGIMLKKIEKSVRRLGDTGWISALQLTMWDNIFGPRVEIVRLLLEITGNALLINT